MKVSSALHTLSFASCALAHGYIKFIGIDNKLYPGWDTIQDDKLGAKRIGFSHKQSSQGRFAVTDQLSPDITCNKNPTAPALIGTGRAGSKITFVWSPWLLSHKGPVLTYMAPYEGDIAKVNLQQLEFFKIQETGLLRDNITWGTDLLNQAGNITTATIPHDIKPGKYVLRHEIPALHFSTEDSVWTRAKPAILGPQHYLECFNIEVTGGGTVTPPGVKFPGGYKHFRNEPGLYFDIYWGVTPYPTPGPPLYVPSSPAPPLTPLPLEVVAPMDTMEASVKWWQQLFVEARTRDYNIVSLNTQRPKHGPLDNYTGPAEGSVPKGAVVLGKEYYRIGPIPEGETPW